MRKAIILTLLSTTGAGSVGAMSSLDALSMIESGDNDHAIGSVGEVSRFQIRPHIWRHYTQNPNYRNPLAARAIAGQFLSDLEADFRRRAGRAPSDFDRYVLWNAGATYYARIGFSKARVGKTIRDRATRYANLCQLRDDREQVPTAILASAKPTPVPSNKVGSAPDGRGPVAQHAATPAPVTTAAQVISLIPAVPGVQMEFPAFSIPLPPSNGGSSPPAAPARPQQGVLALGGIGLP